MSAELNIDTLPDGSLALKGRLTANSLPSLRIVARKALRQTQSSELVIDLARLDYIDSLSIGALIMLANDARQQGRQLVLTRPQAPVQNVFRMLHIDRVLAVQP